MRRAPVPHRESRRYLVETLADWTEPMVFPLLRRDGVNDTVADELLPSVSNRNNPAALPPEALRVVLRQRL